MKLAKALQLTQFSRDTFNTLQQKGSLPFLAGARGDRYSWDFDYSQVLALKVFQELRALGVSLDHCNNLIASGWSEIEQAACRPRVGESIMLSLVYGSEGLWYQGQHSEGRDLEPPAPGARGFRYALTVDLAAIARDLRALAVAGAFLDPDEA